MNSSNSSLETPQPPNPFNPTQANYPKSRVLLINLMFRGSAMGWGHIRTYIPIPIHFFMHEIREHRSTLSTFDPPSHLSPPLSAIQQREKKIPTKPPSQLFFFRTGAPTPRNVDEKATVTSLE